MDFTELMGLHDVVVDNVKETEKSFLFYCSRKGDIALCPSCHQPASKVRNYYQRRIQDQPITGHTVWLIFRLRRFNCLNPQCPRKEFVETLDFAPEKTRRTNRLDKSILEIAYKQSSMSAAKELNDQGILIKHTTICTMLKKKHTNKPKGRDTRRN